jgi:hypothetical protein
MSHPFDNPVGSTTRPRLNAFHTRGFVGYNFFYKQGIGIHQQVIFSVCFGALENCRNILSGMLGHIAQDRKRFIDLLPAHRIDYQTNLAGRVPDKF